MSISNPKSYGEAGARVRGIVESTEAASIGLLVSIDDTVDTLATIARIFREFAHLLAQVSESVKSREIVPSGYFDPEDKSIEGLARCEANLKDHLTVMVRKRSTIDKDCALKDHHCESLHDAYEQAIEATALLIEETQLARAAIISHDLAAEPRDGKEAYSSVTELIAGLRGQ